MYRYYGLIAGKLKALLALTSASLGLVSPANTNHAAVWLGASTPDARSWVQAGIERMAWERRPRLYIEIGRGRRQVYLRTWPMMAHHHARVHLYRRGRLWRVVIDGHSSPRVYLPHAHALTVLETFSPSPIHATADVDGRIVRAR